MQGKVEQAEGSSEILQSFSYVLKKYQKIGITPFCGQRVYMAAVEPLGDSLPEFFLASSNRNAGNRKASRIKKQDLSVSLLCI